MKCRMTIYWRRSGYFDRRSRSILEAAFLGTLGNKEIDFSSFLYGVSLNAETVKNLTVTGMGRVRRILFIEKQSELYTIA